MGIVESFSAASIIEAADAAAKAAAVTLFRIHLAMALGGKGFLLMAGTVADCRAGVDVAAEVVRERGLLVSSVVIPGRARNSSASISEDGIKDAIGPMDNCHTTMRHA